MMKPTHFQTLLGYLDAADVAYTLDPYLVRGFDYYTRTAFEIQSPDLGRRTLWAAAGATTNWWKNLAGRPRPASASASAWNGR